MAQGIEQATALGAVAQQPQKSAFTVLVVDDDQLVLELLQEYLRSDEFKVITAGSGEEGISKMRAAKVDIALVDYKMPGMDGLETIERMTESDPETVTILMTGFPTIDSSIKAMKLGASNYILKPFKLDEVNLAVTKAAQEYQVRQEMRNLRKRVAEFEKGISEKKESIKFNQKLNIISTPEGYSTRITAHEAEPPRTEENSQQSDTAPPDDKY